MGLETVSLDEISTTDWQIDLFLHYFAQHASDTLSLSLSNIWYKCDDFFREANMVWGMFLWKHTVINEEKFLNVPLQTAKLFYEELMYSSYVIETWWWTSNKIPYCSVCNLKVDSYKDLCRFYWISTHRWECAQKRVSEMYFNKEDKLKKQYFERVSKL